MRSHIIITILPGYDNEGHQGGLALYYKCVSKNEPVVWVNTELFPPPEPSDQVAAGQGDGAAAVAAAAAPIVAAAKPALKPPAWSIVLSSGAIDPSDVSVYLIGHGDGGKVGSFAAAELAAAVEQFLCGTLGLPPRTQLRKIVLLSCNVGKLREDAPPTYPEDVARAFRALTTGKVVSWNSYVTIYSFHQLLNLAAKHSEEVSKMLMPYWERMATTLTVKGAASPLQTQLADHIKAAAGGTAGKLQPIAGKFKFAQHAEVSLAELLKLVGRRIGDAKPDRKRLSRTEDLPWLRLSMPPLNPMPLILNPGLHARSMTLTCLLGGGPVADLTGPTDAELMTRVNALKRLFAISQIAQLIMQYEGHERIWSYLAGSAKLTLTLTPPQARAGATVTLLDS